MTKSLKKKIVKIKFIRFQCIQYIYQFKKSVSTGNGTFVLWELQLHFTECEHVLTVKLYHR